MPPTPTTASTSRRPKAAGSYLSSGHFVEATAENWESEFLQMSGYVFLTAFLRQRGSPESKPTTCLGRYAAAGWS